MARQTKQTANRPTRLEREVLDALSWELSAANPGLTGLITDILVSRRFNTGAGFINTLTAPTAPRTGGRGPTGLFGSIHVVFEGLSDAVGFQLQLKSGVPIALIADAYDQDTSGLDLPTAAFSQLFFIDARGRSQPIPRRAAPEPTVFRDPRRPAPAVPTASLMDDAPAWTPPTLRETVTGKPESSWSAGIETAAPEASHKTVRAFVWGAVWTIAGLLGLATGGWIVVGVGGLIIGQALTRPRVIAQIARVAADQGWGVAR